MESLIYSPVDNIDVKHSNTFQYRWILIFYHAGKEMSRTPGSVWYDSLQDCKKAAEEYDFDYCCGFSFEFEGHAHASDTSDNSRS